MEIPYKVMANKFDLRLEMVRSAQKCGVSETARLFRVSRPTVHKWRDRFKEQGLRGLEDRSRCPHHNSNRLDDSIGALIILLKRKIPHCGANRLGNEFGVIASSKTIQKVFREEGLTRVRRSKRTKQRDLHKWKEQNFEPLRYWQVDTKDCSDVPYYVERIWCAHFPR